MISGWVRTLGGASDNIDTTTHHMYFQTYCQAQAQVRLSLRLTQALSGSYFVTLTLRPEPGANIKFGVPPTHHPPPPPLNFSSGDKDSKPLLYDF